MSRPNGIEVMVLDEHQVLNLAFQGHSRSRIRPGIVVVNPYESDSLMVTVEAIYVDG